MNEFIHANAYSLRGFVTDTRTLVLTFGASIICHLVFFSILIFGQISVPHKRLLPPAINVRMVTLPAAVESDPVINKSVVQETAAPEVKEEVIPEPKIETKKISIPKEKPKQIEKKVAPKAIPIKPKKSLKKQTYKASKVKKSAVKKLESKVDKARPQKIKSAIDKLKNKVASTGPAGPLTNSSKRGQGVYGGKGEIGDQILRLIDIYKAEVPYHIQKNWAFSRQLAGDSNKFEAVLVIKIMQSGAISDIWFEKKSGNSYLDESAYKAIKKSNPLPPLPEGYLRPFYNLGLIFTPTGLK